MENKKKESFNQKSGRCKTNNCSKQNWRQRNSHEKLVAGSVECYDNELECNNGYEIQFYVGTYCGSYSIIVDVEQLEYRKLLIIYFVAVVQNDTIFN